MQAEEVNKYDLVVKDLFQRDHPSLLDRLSGGVGVRHVLNVELARVEERRADLVFLLEDDSVLHLEFQSRNDKDMPYREGIYCLLLGQKYRRRIRQAVIYLGEPKMRMVNRLDLGQTTVSYTLIDIRELDARELLAEGRPGDLSLALLAAGGPEQMSLILKRAVNLPGNVRQNVLSQLVVLSGLRRLRVKLIMELNSMLSTTDPFLQIPLVQDMIRNKQTKMLRSLIKVKFRSVPKWADERLQSATSVQIERWARKLISAETLEGVLGKK